jgi:predicted Zn finger-like uncharacterized protein
MVKVECDGCRSPYQIDERRIPPTGLKMRCPKCGKSILVNKPAGGADAPAAPAASDMRMQPTMPFGLQGGPGAPAKPKATVIGIEPPAPPPPAAPPMEQAPLADAMMDLPAARQTAQAGGFGGFGEINMLDLPAVGGPPPGPPAPAPRGPALSADDLPVVGGRKTAVQFGDIDLPVAAEENLPARPDPRAGRGPTLRGFGEIDLPSVSPGGAPGPHGGGGMLDLPAVSPHSGLPMPAGAGLPAPAGIGLPAPGGAGFPMAAHAGLPAPAGAGFPAPAQAGLPAPAGAGFPATAQAGFPAPATAGFPATPGGPSGYGGGGGAGLPAYGTAGLPAPQRAGLPAPRPDAVGEELALGEGSTAGPTPLADFPSAPPPDGGFGPPAAGGGFGGMGDGFGEGIDLADADAVAAGGGVARPRAAAAIKGPGGAPLVEIAKKPSKAPRYILLGAAVFLLAGGSLTLSKDIGAFGVYFISDKINGPRYESSLETLRKSAQESLDSDTFVASARALNDARAASAAAPRHKPTAAYSAYVVYGRSLRFGRRSEDEAYGKQALADAQVGSTDDLVALAAAAQDATSGQLARARQSIGALASRRPNDIDVAALAGEIELAAKAPDKAVAVWKHAVELKKSARTLFGLARAQFANGDPKAAEATAKAAVDASPKHVGARTLLASIYLQTAGREGDAQAMLSKVTEDKEVRGAASDAELVDAYTLLGRLHLAKSRMSAAEQAFAAALKLDPQAVNALVGNGELFYRAGRFSEALARFEGAMKADADSVLAKVGLAKTMLGLERMKEAKDSLKRLREQRATDPLVAFWLGRAEEALGNKKEAEAAYVDAIKVGKSEPEVVDAYVALSHLLAGLGRAEDASTRLTEATAKFPDLPALHRAKGELSLETGRYDDARKEFEAALAKEDDLGARFKLGVALRRMRGFEEAAAIFDKVAAVDKDYPGLALERGLLFEETGQSERALEMYADALRKAPNDVDMKLRVGSTQVMAGHAKQAEPILREVLRDRPNSAEANHFLGRALLVKGTNLSEAMRFLERAVEIDPNHAEYWLYVGWGANEAGQPGRAETVLKRALELDKDLGDAYWQRGVLLQKQGATADALQDLQTALEKRPSRYEAYATMALCFQDQQKYGEAEEAWRKAIAKDETVPEWHFRLGKLYEQRNDKAGMLVEIQKAIDLAEQPDRPSAGWHFDAYRLVAEASETANKEKAIKYWHKFMELAPADNAYRAEGKKALERLEGRGVR